MAGNSPQDLSEMNRFALNNLATSIVIKRIITGNSCKKAIFTNKDKTEALNFLQEVKV